MLIIDRLEGNFAVAENTDTDEMINIEINMIEEGAREGDVIILENERYKVDTAATEKRRQEIIELLGSIDIK